ncbi:MAG: hypothetical protein JXO49_00045 [Deltaproteobacteria bacterium]|nr:hypothetical protein [Candidatus Anaeroferrophillus wilburensis]MBN2887714.1 hypothetical protein [Deltaproteobacteria bacterium]
MSSPARLPGTDYCREGSDSFTPTVAAGNLRVGILSNPLSGGNRRGLPAIRNLLRQQPQISHWEVENPAAIGSALKVFSQQGINLVVVNGGDGTISAVLTALLNQGPFSRLPLLAVLRAGTTSMTAGDVGLPGSAKKALTNLLTWTNRNEARATVITRPILRVAGGGDSLYGMFFGAAGIPQGISFFHRRVNRLGITGELGPGLVFARFLLAMRQKNRPVIMPTAMQVVIDGNPPGKEQFFLLMVSTLERLFFGLRPFWGSEDRPLHYTAVRSQPERFFRLLPHLARGHNHPLGTPENGYYSHNCTNVELTFNGPFTLDGQLYDTGSRQPLIVADGGLVHFLQLRPHGRH